VALSVRQGISVEEFLGWLMRLVWLMEDGMGFMLCGHQCNMWCRPEGFWLLR